MSKDLSGKNEHTNATTFIFRTTEKNPKKAAKEIQNIKYVSSFSFNKN